MLLRLLLCLLLPALWAAVCTLPVAPPTLQAQQQGPLTFRAAVAPMPALPMVGVWG